MVPRRRLMMAILDWTRPKDPPLSLGAASIISQLTHHGIPNTHKSWAVNAPSFHADQVVDWIVQEDAQSRRDGITLRNDVGLGAFVWNERHVRSIMASLKRARFKGDIIVGGPQVSYVSHGVENYYPHGDIFIRGYAEDAIVQLMTLRESGVDQPVIRGVHYRGQHDAGLSTKTNLDTLTSPLLTGLVPIQRFVRWETQRGCPFACSFCQHRASDQMQREAGGRRALCANRIEREAAWICAHPTISDVAVLDPTFNSGPNYMHVLDQLIRGGFHGKLALQCRLEMIKHDFLDKVQTLRHHNGANVVLEFGIQTVIPEEQRAIRRMNNLNKAATMLAACRERGIPFEISLIFGLPLQTLTSFKQSVAWAQQQEPTTLLAFPLMLLRGTPLYDEKDRYGLVESTEYAFQADDEARQQFDIPHVVQSNSFSYADWKEMANIASRLKNNSESELTFVMKSLCNLGHNRT